MAEALATVTPLLTKTTSRRPPARMLRAALYGYAFSPPRRSRAPEPATASALAWLERNSLPVSHLSDPQVIRAALDGLCVRLDGSPAAANTITRKRAVFHNALGYAAELGLLPANPAGTVQWHAPKAAVAVSPQTVASPAQVSGHPGPGRPDTPGPGGVLRLPVLRGAAPRRSRRPSPKPSHPPGARARGNDSHRRMPAHRLDQQWQAARVRGLKHRPTGTVRIVPFPPILVSLLRQHIRESGTASDGRLFHGTRGGPLSESVYGRVWHAARQAALGPALAATPLARRPYDLRHAALSLWLNASGAPAEVAARAGTSVHVLANVYVHCIGGQEDVISQRIEDALNAGSRTSQEPPPVTASGSPNRRHHREPVRHMSVHDPRQAARHHLRSRKTRTHLRLAKRRLCRSEEESARPARDDDAARTARPGPRIAHKRSAEPLPFSVRAGDALPRHRL